MKFWKEKTPDQIRRETVPVKHTGLVYGLLGGVLGIGLWFGGWGLLHQEQVRRFPQYTATAIKARMHGLSFSLSGQRPKRERGMNADQLRYSLMRYGNKDHRFDPEIVRHGWYPKEASPAAWVYANAAVQPIYSDSPFMVFKWPLTLSLFTFLGALTFGLVIDYRYRSAIIGGLPFDGSVVATVREYKKEVKGDGMKYRAKTWRDR
jgi:hypothetical protein